MRRRSVIALILALALSGIAAPAGAFGFTFFTYRYRLIVEIEVDGNVRTDSSVVQIRWVSQPTGLSGGMPWGASITGQATLVDLELGARLPRLPDACNICTRILSYLPSIKPFEEPK